MFVWLCYRNKRNEAKSSRLPAHYPEGQLPFVTVQLPIFNEQFVIDRLLDACCRPDHLRDRFEIQPLDDSTDETREVASAMVARFAAGTAELGPQPVYYIHRTNRHGYKAEPSRKVCAAPRVRSSQSSTPTSSLRRNGSTR